MKRKFISFALILVLIISTNISFVCAELIPIGYNNNTGCLEYNATVTVATTSTKYKVIGFDVKFKNYNTFVKLEQFSDINNGDGTVTVPFSIPFVGDGNTIMQRFIEKYGKNDDFINFFANDNTIYLDAIMTVVENGSQLATMNYNGTFTNRNGGNAKLGTDYFTTLSGIKTARSWKHPEDLNNYYNLYCKFKGNPPPDKLLAPPTAKISKGGSIVTGILSYMADEPINLSGDKSIFPSYADGKMYKWEIKPKAASTWNTLSSGLGMVSQAFTALAPGDYDVKLTVWYKIGDREYLNMSNSTQVILNITEAPKGAYVTVEITCDPDKLVTQAQIDANENVPVNVTIKATLHNFTDINSISKWILHLRKDIQGTDTQYQKVELTTNLGLTAEATKSFTVPAGLLKDKEKFTQMFVGSAEVILK